MDRQTIMMASIAVLLLLSLYLYRENKKLKEPAECPMLKVVKTKKAPEPVEQPVDEVSQEE